VREGGAGGGGCGRSSNIEGKSNTTTGETGNKDGRKRTKGDPKKARGPHWSREKPLSDDIHEHGVGERQGPGGAKQGLHVGDQGFVVGKKVTPKKTEEKTQGWGNYSLKRKLAVQKKNRKKKAVERKKKNKKKRKLNEQ